MVKNIYSLLYPQEKKNPFYKGIDRKELKHDQFRNIHLFEMDNIKLTFFLKCQILDLLYFFYH